MKTIFLQTARSLLAHSTTNTTWQWTALMLLVQLLSLVAFLLVAFDNNRAYLLFGLDGHYMMTIAKQQHVWMPMSAGLTNNFFQSLGNVWFPLNTALIPGYAISLFSNGGEIDPVLSYVIFSVELFAAVFILSMSLRQNWLVSAIAAWGLVLSVMPLFENAAVYPIFGLVPHGATLIAWSLIALVLFGSVGRRGHGWSAGCACGVLIVLLYIGITQPAGMILTIPGLAVFGIFLALGAGSRHERNAKLVAGVVLIAAVYFLGLLPFVHGLIKYTAVSYLGSELINNRQTMQYASIAFHKAQFGIAGPILFWLGFAGSLLTAVAGSGKLRVVAIGTMSYMVVLLIAGTVATYTDSWHGPSPLYFEFFLWPFYAVYAAILLNLMFDVSTKAVWKLPVRDTSSASEVHHRTRLLVQCASLACAPWLLFTLCSKVTGPRDFHYPPGLTPIVALLKNEIGLTPGSFFRGRVATLTGMQLPTAISWSNLHTLDFSLDRKFGNEHRMFGLWYFDIPTLFEYSSIITPSFYLVTRTFFARPGDVQIRNVLTLRQFEPKILRSLGVRFAITDAPLNDGTRLRLSFPSPDHTLYLYELDEVNMGNYSPTEYRVSTDARETLAKLAKPSFDPKQQVLSDVQLHDQGSFVAASSSKLTAEPGHLHISANSISRSILVLPLEYSHCLNIQQTKVSNMPLPQLFRANLLQAGILFEGKLDATVAYFTGPFHNADCRLKDALDMEKLSIREAAAPVQSDTTVGSSAKTAAHGMPWQSYQKRGDKRATAGDFKGALEDYTAAFKDSPPNPALYFLRGSAKMKMEDYKGAAEDFESGLKLDPGNAPLKVLLTQARAGKAGVLAQPVSAAGSGKPTAEGMPWQSYQERGGKRAAAGDLKGALEDYTAALKDSPPNPALYFLSGSVKMQLDNFKGASEDFDAGLKLDPTNAPLKQMLQAARAKTQGKRK